MTRYEINEQHLFDVIFWGGVLIMGAMMLFWAWLAQ